jgi:hypothetical protein
LNNNQFIPIQSKTLVYHLQIKKKLDCCLAYRWDASIHPTQSRQKRKTFNESLDNKYAIKINVSAFPVYFILKTNIKHTHTHSLTLVCFVH